MAPSRLVQSIQLYFICSWNQVTLKYLTEFSKTLERIEPFERVKVLLKRIVSS